MGANARLQLLLENSESKRGQNYNKNKNSAKGYVAPGKDHVSRTCNCNSYS